MIGPMSGRDSSNRTANGKKFPNRFSAPNIWIMSPKKHHPTITSRIPTKKHMDDLILFFSRKKALHRWGPIVRATPATNRMFPRVSIELSRNIMIPKKKKNPPKPVRRTPILVASLGLYKESIY